MKRWRSTWWLVPLGLVAAVVLVTNVFPFRTILAEHQKVEDAHLRLAELRAENTILEEQVAALTTAAEIERLARQKLGYVREGEIAFVVLPEEGSPASRRSVPADAGEPGSPWWERIWEFLTGADLVDGG